MKRKDFKKRTAFILAVIMTVMNCLSLSAGELPVSENGILEEVNETEAEESAVVEEPEVTEDIVVEDVEETVEEEVKKSAPEEVKAVEDNEAVVEEEPEEPELLAAAPEEEAAEVSEVQEDTEEVVIESVESEPDEILRADDSDYGVWHTYQGIMWMVSGNRLSISANAHPASGIPGEMPDFSSDIVTYESGSLWLKNYREVIEEVEFMDSLEDPTIKVWKIGEFAFSGCCNLNTIPIPSSIREIGYGAFIGCDKLSGFSITENEKFIRDAESGILYRKESEDRYEMLFAPLNRKGTLVISDKTYKIGNYACWGAKCYKGTLKIPASVKYIGNFAFEGCTEFTSIIMGERKYGDYPDLVNMCKSELLTIGADAFAGCDSLREVYIPSSVEEVNQNAFDRDTYLTYVYCYSVHPAYDDKSSVYERFRVCDGFKDIKFLNTDCIVVYVPWNYCIVTFSPTISIAGEKGNPTLIPTCVQYDTTMYETGTEVNTELYVLKKKDYVFEGWAYDDQAGKSFDHVNDIIKADTRLKAKWTRLYKITFDTNGGYFSNEAVQATRIISADKVLTDWPSDPEKTDARFVGWQVGSKNFGTIVLLEEGDESANKFANKAVRDEYLFLGRDVILYAYYEDYPLMNFWNENGTENIYKKYIDSDSNGMKIRYNKPFSKSQVADINTISMNYWMDPNNFKPEERDRYVFQGWYSRTGGKGTKLRVDNTSSLYSAMPLKYYIYFKQYLKVTYYFGYDKSGKTVNYEKGIKEEEKNIEAKKDYALRLPPSRPGYVFKGWWSTKDESGVRYAAGIPANSMKSDLNIYAHWQKLCTIKLNRCFEDIPRKKPAYDEEYMNKHPELKTVEKLENITEGNQLYYNYLIPYDKMELTDEGDRYKFEGWYTERNGKGEKIESTDKIEKDMELYAHWVKGYAVNYFVDVNKTGGKVLFWGTVVSPKSPSNPTGSTLPVPPKEMGDPVPEKYEYLGYLFDGWADDVTGNPPDTTEIVDRDRTFNAIWYDDPNTPNDPQVTVSFDSAGGPEVPSQTVSENNPIKDPEVEWKDHKFLGWFTDTTYTRQWDFVTDMVSENMILHAKWKYWTEEDEAQYQDNLNGIYWVKIVRTEKASLAQYFTEGGLKYSYDTHIIKFNRSKRMVKGRNHGSTLITARRVDGTPYEKAVRVFVIDQRLQDMYVYNTDTTLEASDFLTVSGFLPDRWQSTKPKVASIDPKTGFIHVNGRGKTTIKAFYREKAVKAVLYSRVPKFAKPFVRMKTGQSKKLKIRKMRRRDIVSWNVVSDNKGGSAEIDENGRITALTAGDVTVVAYAYGEKISCKVHIEPPILRQKSIALYTNKKKKLKLSNTKLKYVEWTSTNDQVAYVDPVTGTVYGLKNGRATLKTTAGGVTNVCSVLVTDKVNLNGNKK